MVESQQIVSSLDVCGGSPRVKGTRVPVWTLVRMRQLGVTENEILDSYPTVNQIDLHQVWSYVDQNRQAIDQEIAENER